MRSTRLVILAVVPAATLLAGPAAARAQVVPGSGRLSFIDRFEDENWSYVFNGRKSSREQDGRTRSPRGFSRNRKWIESAKRGQPDVVKRVATPEGGISGSKGALLLRSRNTGIPGRITNKMQQDDFLARARTLSVAMTPNVVVRVYVPPYDQFENRTGSSFGFRAGARTTKREVVVKRGFLGIGKRRDVEEEEEAYWPGMFIVFNSSHAGQVKEDSAVLLCRSDNRGREFPGPRITPGWWTLGMSFTPDGRVHYFASPGVDDLTRDDFIASTNPYGYTCERVTTLFFNICSADNGKSWSTPWIVDDPAIYYYGGSSQARRRRGLFDFR